MLGTLRCARAELAQAHSMTTEAGDDFPVRARFERDVSGEPGGYRCRRNSCPSLYSGSAHAG
jgi:hypothetical protein